MTEWFRSWHGAPTDPKWLVVADKAKVTPLFVSAVAWALFDHASQATERGDVSGFDFETYAKLMVINEKQVRAVYAALEAKGIIVSGRIAQWEKRQPKREDNSTERVRAQRKRADPEREPPLPLAAPSDDKPTPEPPDADLSAQVEQSEHLMSSEAVQLADEIAVIAGHELENVPPSWCGAAYRTQAWLNAGWRRPFILEVCKAQMNRKRDGPPGSIQYFEKGIARAHAQSGAPLPAVIVSEQEVIHAKAESTAGGFTSISRDLERRGDARRAGGSLRVIDGSGDS